jgi:hypothetical protein
VRAQAGAAAQIPGAISSPDVKPDEAAAWVAVARTVLNLDEFLTRE